MVGTLGHCGGLSMFWKEKDWAQVIGSSRNHIDIEVSMQDMGVWRLTGYYGFPEKYRRRDTWHMLWTLSQKSPFSWCCIGDYNDLLFQKEKIGHLCHHVGLLLGFRKATEASGLQDLGMIGYPFTWEKSKGTTDWVEECLDHGMASQSWLSIFSNSIVYSIEASESDHLPIFLDRRQLPRRNRHQRFRFENMWLREPECGVVVKNSWESLPGETIQDRIQICGHALAEWGRSLGRDFRLQISDCRNSMAYYRGKKDSSSSEEFV